MIIMIITILLSEGHILFLNERRQNKEANKNIINIQK